MTTSQAGSPDDSAPGFGRGPDTPGGVPAPGGSAVATALDLRLVPAAAAVWLATFAGLAWSPATSVVVASCLALPAAVLLRRGPAWRHAAALAMAGGAVAALLIGVRVHARDVSPLRRLATEHSDVTLWLVVRDDPRPLRPRGADGARRVAFPARVVRMSAAQRGWRGGGEVLVLAPADRWRDLSPSQRLRARGRLGLPLSGDLTVAVLVARGPPRDVGPPSLAQRVGIRLREGLRAAAAVLPSDERGLLPGLVLGDISRLDSVVAEDFRAAGLTHLLAVSGSNLTVVVGAVLLMCRWCHADPRHSAVLAGLALAGFVVVVRPSPSVLRAAAMGTIALAAVVTGRPRTAVPALAASVLVLLLAAPNLARSPGFALSVLATGGLLVLAPPWARVLRRHGVPAGLAEALAIPAAAHLVTAPIVAALSGQVSLAAVPANLLVAPAVAPVTVLGVVATVVAPASLTVASGMAWLAALPTAWLVTVARSASAAPLASVRWPGGAAGAWSLAGTLALLLLAVRFRPARRCMLAAAVGALLVVIPSRFVLPRWPPPRWVFVACDVGQGDALVLNAGPGAAVVVDTGPDPAAVDRCLRRLGVRRVPLVVLTHLHADHAGGLSGVLRGRRVGAVETGPLDEPAWTWSDVRRDVAGHRLALVRSGPGETREVGGVRLRVLAPAVAFHGTRSDPNNSSVVLRVAVRGHTLLLTGDVELEAQRAILASGADLRAELLKVPHHGSSYSDPRFLAATGARLAVISVGQHNDYGHPSPVLLARLAALGMRTYRTDTAGDIAAYDSGGRLAMATRARGPPVTPPHLRPAAPRPPPCGTEPWCYGRDTARGMPRWSSDAPHRARSVDPRRG